MAEGGGWNAVFRCNHDQPRAMSRFGDDGQYHDESATMLATAIEQYRDVESLNYYQILREAGKTEAELWR